MGPPTTDILNSTHPTHTPTTTHPTTSIEKTLHEGVSSHYRYYKQGYLDNTIIPFYLFLSDAGTGTGTVKSRNAAEFHNTVRKWFDGTFFKQEEQENERNDGLAA